MGVYQRCFNKLEGCEHHQHDGGYDGALRENAWKRSATI
jgi:hypothetical protein